MWILLLRSKIILLTSLSSSNSLATGSTKNIQKWYALSLPSFGWISASLISWTLNYSHEPFSCQYNDSWDLHQLVGIDYRFKRNTIMSRIDTIVRSSFAFAVHCISLLYYLVIPSRTFFIVLLKIKENVYQNELKE